MKHLTKIVFAALLAIGGLQLTTSCTDYQDEIDSLDYRVKVLEDKIKALNTNIESLQVIAEAMKGGDYITNVKETKDGYIINFYKNGPIIIKNGVPGEAPEITIEKADDGNWYWKIDGEWLEVGGQKICANGKDGKDAISPKVRINPITGEWEVSTDDGQNWFPTGQTATAKDGENGESFFQSVTYTKDGTGDYMVIVLTGGATFKIPVITK